MRWIIVLGMHRSGTSAFTRAVAMLGASAGDDERLRKHWENIPLRHINERVLAAGGGSWDSPPSAEWLESADVAAFVPDARAVVDREFGSVGPVVWKDPRTCVTLPFWMRVVDPDPVFLLIHRHPLEVAASLATRNSFRTGHGLALWERHNADALRGAAGHSTVVLAYDEILADPTAELVKVHEALTSFGIALPGDPREVDHGLSPRERHHTADEAAALDDPIVTAAQRELFELLRDLNGVHESLTLPRPVPEPHPLSRELLQAAGGLRDARRNRKRSRRRVVTKVSDAVEKRSNRARRGANNADVTEPATTARPAGAADGIGSPNELG